jgi:L-lactate dehydrogenase complex protein LldF
MNHLPGLVKNKMNVWYWQREMPEAPKQSFQEWYAGRSRNK